MGTRHEVLYVIGGESTRMDMFIQQAGILYSDFKVDTVWNDYKLVVFHSDSFKITNDWELAWQGLTKLAEGLHLSWRETIIGSEVGAIEDSEYFGILEDGNCDMALNELFYVRQEIGFDGYDPHK